MDSLLYKIPESRFPYRINSGYISTAIYGNFNFSIIDDLMANKTTPGEKSPYDFIDKLENPARQDEARRLLNIMHEITGIEPVMWGNSMIGFGIYHYKYASGREGDWFKVGFSPRKNEFSIYIMSGFEKYSGLLSQLGKFKTGKSCLYVKKLSDIDEEILRELIRKSIQYIDITYPQT